MDDDGRGAGDARGWAVIAERWLRDPPAETGSELRPCTSPRTTLKGATVALLDIGKTRGDEHLDRLQELLAARGVTVHRYREPTNTRTAPPDLLRRIAGVSVLTTEFREAFAAQCRALGFDGAAVFVPHPV